MHSSLTSGGPPDPRELARSAALSQPLRQRFQIGDGHHGHEIRAVAVVDCQEMIDVKEHGVALTQIVQPSFLQAIVHLS